MYNATTSTYDIFSNTNKQCLEWINPDRANQIQVSRLSQVCLISGLKVIMIASESC